MRTNDYSINLIIKFTVKKKRATKCVSKALNHEMLHMQQNHFISYTFTIASTSPLLSFFCLCFFAFLFHLLSSLSLTLIIHIFYHLNYISLLLHLITTPMVSHLYLSSIIFILSDTNYQHLLLS